MPRARRSKSAMRVRVSSTANTNASSVNRRCGTLMRVGSLAPQWSATSKPDESFSPDVGYSELIVPGDRHLVELSARDCHVSPCKGARRDCRWLSLSLRQAYQRSPPSIHDAEVEQWTELI